MKIINIIIVALLLVELVGLVFLYSAPKLEGDVNGDCIVNILDLSQIGYCYGEPVEGSCAVCDLNNDGAIDQMDLDIATGNLGNSC